MRCRTIATKNDKAMPNIGFKMMSALFTVRDLFNDPMKKIKKAKVSRGHHVLDYGCGPGAYTIAAAKVVGDSGKVYAADIHPLSAKKINAKALSMRLENIETITTDCYIGLDDESIDRILCFDMFHMLKEPNKVLKEFHRVIKPNSILSLDCHHLNDIQNRIEQSKYFKLVDKIGKTFNFEKL
ncbi:MAG: class I SAM-dependent methyltransferase [Promethearchaeota archaeon]